jgi:hypothetical protein
MTLRRAYVILALITVVLGLAVHFGGSGLPPRTRDVVGDALWAAMIFWLVSLAVPSVGIARRAAAALAVCVVVELSQKLEHPILHAIRGTTIGHLVIGSDFDARDLVAYTAGIVAAVLLDAAVCKRVPHKL